MKRALIVIFLTVLLGTFGLSNEVNKQKLIKELFEITEVENVKGLADSVIDTLTSQELNLTDKQRKELSDEMKIFMDFLINKQMELYAKHYSEQELSGILKFYKTSVGKKSLEKSLIINQEFLTEMNNYYPILMEKVKKIVEN